MVNCNQSKFFSIDTCTRDYVINPCCHLDDHGRRIKSSSKKLVVASIVESFFPRRNASLLAGLISLIRFFIYSVRFKNSVSLLTPNK